MALRNCWDVMKCGRQACGSNVKEQGVCPAAADNKFSGVNRGHRCGRFCWAIAGTFCEGKTQGTFAQKAMECINCNFFKMVQDEESNGFIFSTRELKKK